MTSAELLAYQARHAPKQTTAADGCADEAELHAQIFDECRRRGWLPLHGAMSERTHRSAGEWDFTILTDCAVFPRHHENVLFIEVKTRTGKLSTAQRAMHAHAAKLGHTVHVVRSMAAFLEIIK